MAESAWHHQLAVAREPLAKSTKDHPVTEKGKIVDLFFCPFPIANFSPLSSDTHYSFLFSFPDCSGQAVKINVISGFLNYAHPSLAFFSTRSMAFRVMEWYRGRTCL